MDHKDAFGALDVRVAAQRDLPHRPTQLASSKIAVLDHTGARLPLFPSPLLFICNRG